MMNTALSHCQGRPDSMTARVKHDYMALEVMVKGKGPRQCLLYLSSEKEGLGEDWMDPVGQNCL